MRRTRSSVEIQCYAEDEDDEDYSDIFSRIEVTPIKADSESESEQGTLMLNSKLSNNSWLGDDDDEDDPFAQLEEGFDEMDLQANLARDKFARLCTQVEGLVGSLKVSQSDEVLADLSDQLVRSSSLTGFTLLTALDGSTSRVARDKGRHNCLSWDAAYS
jgi:hypothetical protein